MTTSRADTIALLAAIVYAGSTLKKEESLDAAEYFLNQAAERAAAQPEQETDMGYDTCKNASPYDLGVNCRRRHHSRDSNNMANMVAKAEFDRGWCDENARQGLPENAPAALRGPHPIASSPVPPEPPPSRLG
jgi:hypothetical protein